MVKPIPERCHSITPYLIVKDGAAAIELYGKAFDADEIYRLTGPDGSSVMHAEIKIGDSVVFLAGVSGPMEVAYPQGEQWPSVVVHLYVQDADATWQRAVDAGCEGKSPPADMFWGDRMGKLIDPFGHHWSIAQHIEDVSPEEISRRAAELFAQHSGPSQ